MPYKDKEKQKEYHKAWYKKHKGIYLERTKRNNRKYWLRNKEYVNNIKSNNPCYVLIVIELEHGNELSSWRNR